MALLRPLGLDQLARRRSEKWAGQPTGVISSTIAELDFEVAEPVAEALRAAVAAHDFGYTPSANPTLDRAFTGFAARRLDWEVDPDQISLVPDVMVGISMLARALCGPGGTVALVRPAYPPFLTELPADGLQLRSVELAPDATVDLDSLRTVLRAGADVLVLSSPHNPTGRVYPRAHLEQIAEVCAEHDVWVLADEIHAPLTLSGARHVPWLEVSDAARRQGITLTSASKAFNLAALKCALVVTASSRARDAVRRLGDQTDHVGLLGVIGAEAAFTAGDAWLDALLAQLDANRDRLGARLAAELPGITWTPPQATFLAWLDCRGTGLADPATVFAEHGVALSAGSEYDPQSPGSLRLNFGTSPELLEQMLDRMVDGVRGSRPR